jgi:MFS family permease
LATFAILILAYLLSQFFRAFLAVIAPELARDVGLGAGDLGLVSGAFFVTFAVAQIPIGIALDRVGPRLTVAVLMLAAVAGSLLFGVADRPWQPVVGMGLIGIGCAPVFMASLYIIGRTKSAAGFATWSSLIVAVGSLGNLFAATPFASLVAAYGWRAAMTAIGLVTAASALSVLVFVRDPPPAVHTGKAGHPFAMGEVFRLRQLWPIFPLALTGYPIVAATRGLWIGPYFAEVHGLGPVDRGNAVSAMVVAMIVGAMVYGPLDRILGTRKWVVVGGSLAALAALVALAVRPDTSVVTAALLFAVVGGFGMTYGVIMAHVRAFLPEHVLGRGLSVMNTCMIGGAGLLQPVSGAYVQSLAAAGTPPAQIYAALFGAFAVLLAGALAVYLLARDARPTG